MDALPILTSDEKKPPWWLWPNLLSLDAPLVALAWLWLYGQIWGVMDLPWELWVALAAAVWMIYALDRIIDTADGSEKKHWEVRHHFHRKHRQKFLVLVIALALWCAWATLAALSKSVIGYGFLVGAVVLAYFLLALDARKKSILSLPKNLIASAAFALGVASAAHAYAPFMTIGGMITEIEVWLFAGLCFLNISAIDFWALENEDEEEAASVLAFGALVLGGVAMYFASTVGIYQRPFFYAVIVGVGALYFLNRLRGRFSLDERRVLVDVTLLLPPLVHWFWMRLYVLGVL